MSKRWKSRRLWRVETALLTARKVAKALHRAGFVMVHQAGSHTFWRHPDGRTTTVPDKGAKKLGRGLLGKIIKHDLKMSRNEFLRLLK